MSLSRAELGVKFNEFFYQQTQARRNALDPNHATYNPLEHARDTHARKEHGDTHADMESQILAAASAILDVIAANDEA